MDEELKRYLDGMKTELKADLERVNRALKADLERMATKADLERMATKADLERVETALLTEFHKWAAPSEARSRSLAATVRALDMEFEALRERVEKLEQKQGGLGH